MEPGKKQLGINMRYIDANVILRYILDDHTELSPTAKEIIDSSEVFITTEVLAEVVYVLSGVYHVDRKTVRNTLTAFISDSCCDFTKPDVILKSLDLFADTKLDYVDCVLAGYAIIDDAEIETFDKQLQNVISKK